MKKCAVIYSGGKDGHLALAAALDSGYEVSCLLNINGGAKHRKYFNELRKPELLKIHSELLGIPLFTWPSPANCSPRKDTRKVLSRLFAAARKKYEFGAVFCGSLEEDEGGNASEFKAHGKALGTRIFTPCEKHNIFTATRETLGRGMVTLIVGANRNVGLQWIGKLMDNAFLAHVRACGAAGNSITANDIQTTVLASPLFDGVVRVLKMRFIKGGAGGFLKTSVEAGRGLGRGSVVLPRRLE